MKKGNVFAGPCVHLMCAPCAFYIERYTATVYAVYIYMCVCVPYYETRWGDQCTWGRLHALRKHAHILRHTMWSIVARNVGDNGESTGRVGSWKGRGTERGENIQFNFETAPAQSTNTKASLQADPCWRLELIHRLQARGERTAGREGGGKRGGSNNEIGGEKRWGDIGRGREGENGGRV